MSKKFKSSYKFSRQKLELFYSVFLLILLPVMLVVNTLVFTSSARGDFDIELRRKAVLANEIFGNTIKDSLDDSEFVQRAIDEIVDTRDDVIDISVSLPLENGKFLVLAAKDESSAGLQFENLQYNIILEHQADRDSVATLLKSEEIGRVWRTATPIFDGNTVVAISSLDLSLSEEDALVAKSLQRSFFIMLATVIATVLLLWNHFKFVEYAQLFRKLKEADQLKSDFLSVATHELKAPMTAIKGYVANVMDGTAGSVSMEAMEQLNVVINQTDRLNALVQDLLNVSRIEQGRIEITMEAVVVADIIKPLVGRYQRQADAKSIKIVYEEPAAGTAVVADKGRFEEIMTNLIDNAVKYSNKGTVTVSHKIDGKALITSVKDSGIGMSSTERERLFQRFYRVKNAKTKEIGGTGLGLWIIKQYVEKMHGQIRVESMENVGTEFIVVLNLPK